MLLEVGRHTFPEPPEELDAVVAAPDNHEIIFENERVRVLRVTIQPGELEKRAYAQMGERVHHHEFSETHLLQ